MKRLIRALAIGTLFVAGASAAALSAGKSPASLFQTTTTGTTTVTTATTTTETTTTTPPRRVTICHQTRSRKNPHRTITISSTALAAHMRHGDSRNACTTRANITRHSTRAHVRRWHRNMTLRAELKAERAKAKKGKGK